MSLSEHGLPLSIDLSNYRSLNEICPYDFCMGNNRRAFRIHDNPFGIRNF